MLVGSVTLFSMRDEQESEREKNKGEDVGGSLNFPRAFLLFEWESSLRFLINNVVRLGETGWILKKKKMLIANIRDFCFLSKNTFIYHQFLFKIPSTITNWIFLFFTYALRYFPSLRFYTNFVWFLFFCRRGWICTQLRRYGGVLWVHVLKPLIYSFLFACVFFSVGQMMVAPTFNNCNVKLDSVMRTRDEFVEWNSIQKCVWTNKS